MSFKGICKKIHKLSPDISVSEEKGCIVLRGHASDWKTIVKAGHAAVDKKKYLGVINDIILDGFEERSPAPPMRDDALDGLKPDVLIIGGGITGCSALRELSRWNLNCILVEKGSDVASGASKANGGVVHVGINFPKDSNKHHYNQIGNAMYGRLSEELDVPFEQKGQVMLCCHKWERIIVWFLCKNGKRLGIPGVKYLKREELRRVEPCVPDIIDGGMYMPTGGITNPYEMTIALAENAIKNGGKVFLNTQVESMEVEDGQIISVSTNRGVIHPKIVINAAGVYADKIAEMAGDRTFTIHPRRGTDIITDKKAGYMVKTSMAKAPFTVLPQDQEKVKGIPFGKIKLLIKSLTSSSHTKGVGLIHSVHGNMLFGPNAVETPYRYDTATYRQEVENIIEMQQKLAPDLKAGDVIAYFTGVRAATYEEDFVVRKGVFTENILEAAGIQSPGVTAAPAIGIDLAKWSVELLNKRGVTVTKNESFDPVRKAPPRLNQMDEAQRDALIKENPDYGVIVCRCEEISKGEILDALNSGLCVPTLDGIKRRLRPGMGRCQGGFCSPLVMEIIAEFLGTDLSSVKKDSPLSHISLGATKSRKNVRGGDINE